MKNKINYFLVVFTLLFAVSCKKNNDPLPVHEPVIPTKIDKTELFTWKFDSFIVDDRNVTQVFPGAIFNIKQNGNDLELVSLKDKYTQLPVTASTSVLGNKSFKDIPSSEKIAAYTKSLPIKSNNESTDYSEDEFKDYNLLKYYLSNNDDVKLIFEKIGIKTSTRITKKHAACIFFSSVRFSLDMNLPTKTELLSIADVDKLNNTNSVYYVNSVIYGSNTLILAEADTDYTLLKTALKAALFKQELTSAQIQSLSTAKVTFYARAGSEKSFIKVANNLDEIKSINEEFETFNKAAIAYPVSYSLRSVKNFSLFEHEVKVNIIH